MAMLVHFFEMTSVGGSEDVYRLKSHVNNWLEKETGKMEIKFIKQNVVEKQGALCYLISVWYEPLKDIASKEALESEEREKRSSASFPTI